MGNAGAAITTLLAPSLLNYLSENDHENGLENVAYILWNRIAYHRFYIHVFL